MLLASGEVVVVTTTSSLVSEFNVVPVRPSSTTRAVGAITAAVVVVAVAGRVTNALAIDPFVIAMARLPALSSTENWLDARTVTTPELPATMLVETVIVHFVGSVCDTELNVMTFVNTKSVAVTLEQSIGSFAVSENITDEPSMTAFTTARVRTGAVTSAMVTLTDAGEPNAMDELSLPYWSATENPDDARRLDAPDEPGDTDEVTVMVHLVDVVCTTPSTVSIEVSTKSDAVTEVQSIGSFPVSVNTIVAEVELDAVAARVNIGGVWSAIVNVRSSVAAEYPSVCAAVARTTHDPTPEYERVRELELTEHDVAEVDMTEYKISPFPVVVAAANV